MNIKAILFDADGVVINSPSFFSLQYQQEFDVPEEVMTPFFKGRFQECLVGKADLKEELKPLLKDWKWNRSVDDLLLWWFKSEHYVDERIVHEIEELKKRNFICCFATNQEKYRVEYMKKEMGFEKLFDKVFSSAEIGYKKKGPEFFKFVLDYFKNNYQISANEILYFDDEQENIDAATSLGINGVLYSNFDNFSSQISENIT
jgi:putative hydrolase of the HAD superfamily